MAFQNSAQNFAEQRLNLSDLITLSRVFRMQIRKKANSDPQLQLKGRFNEMWVVTPHPLVFFLSSLHCRTSTRYHSA